MLFEFNHENKIWDLHFMAFSKFIFRINLYFD